jgi:galactokinase/mevalonate kinase-like predicted kinase
MRSVLKKGDLYGFGRLLHDAWQAKRRISDKISTPQIDALYSLAMENGALGGKITGAGGGGFLLIYCEPGSQQAVREAMCAEGIQEIAFGFDMQGAQAIVNDPFIDGDERGASRWVFVPKSATVEGRPSRVTMQGRSG